VSTIIVECPKCKRTMEIEPEWHGREANAGHATILDPSTNRSNRIQCVCGKYL